jgi:hypothetical protein
MAFGYWNPSSKGISEGELLGRPKADRYGFGEIEHHPRTGVAART